MDVIGNNIANVNTTGYKTSRVIFQDIFSQTVSGGKANTPISGGTNPMQIGLGIKLSTVDVMHTAAPFGRTDNPYDMTISGDGFFIVDTPNGYLYTRAGNFKLDDQGYLTTSDGYYVMGYIGNLDDYYEAGDPDNDPPIPATLNEIDDDFVIDYEGGLMRIRLRVAPNDGDEPIDLVGFSVGEDGSVSVMIDNEKVVIAKIAVAMFSNPSGLEKAGNSMYRVTASSGDAVVTLPQQNGAGDLKGGGLEMSNVDLATEFTDMIVTQRGFQANSRIITVSDTLLEELVNLKR
jgi:flagellar hook protein FlgE